jgi:enolase-phosphatase E1
MTEYVRKADLSDLRHEYDTDLAGAKNPPAWTTDAVPYLHWLMDQDRKSTALKRIQGEIWRQGYASGELHGAVFADVPSAFQRWHEAGIDIRIFSSGSVLAQRLIFSSTLTGDLTKYLNGYFDTTAGPKNEPQSYIAIASAFSLPTSDILFISDVTRELDAARDAGMQTLLCVRPGNHPLPPHTHEVISSFANVV